MPVPLFESLLWHKDLWSTRRYCFVRFTFYSYLRLPSIPGGIIVPYFSYAKDGDPSCRYWLSVRVRSFFPPSDGVRGQHVLLKEVEYLWLSIFVMPHKKCGICNRVIVKWAGLSHHSLEVTQVTRLQLLTSSSWEVSIHASNHLVRCEHSHIHRFKSKWRHAMRGNTSHSHI